MFFGQPTLSHLRKWVFSSSSSSISIHIKHCIYNTFLITNLGIERHEYSGRVVNIELNRQILTCDKTCFHEANFCLNSFTTSFHNSILFRLSLKLLSLSPLTQKVQIYLIIVNNSPQNHLKASQNIFL